VLCSKTYDEEDIAAFTNKIEAEYTVNWILDGLPAAVRMFEEENPEEVHYERGFPLGFAARPGGADAVKRYYIFNHVQFVIYYHQEDGKAEADASGAGDSRFRVVGFEVEPFTVKHAKADAGKEWSGNMKTCSASRPVSRDDDEPQTIDEAGTEVVFTYDVVWRKSDVPWAHRWDLYLQSSRDDDIHVFSIMNSLMIVLFMTGMIAMILVRNLYRDIARYNEETSEESAEESGWKLVHGDVFRPPSGFFGPMFLSVFVGGGMQVFAMALALLIFAVAGFLSPANQGSLVAAFVLLFVFMGSFAGYTSARLYKMFKGKAWKRNTFLTAFCFSGGLLLTVAIINVALASSKSSLTIPFTSVLLLVGLWLGVCAPLVAVGAYFGFKAEEIKHPVRVNNIPRQIPGQPWYLHPIPSVLVGGILPFGAIFIELYFIMSAVWLAQVYAVFGFLFVVLLITAVTCAEISIVMTYFQLCSEDYNWWWRSFLTPGSSALYLFAYACIYFYSKLEITGGVSTFLYFGYMAMIAWCFFLLTGSIGFLSSLAFTNRSASTRPRAVREQPRVEHGSQHGSPRPRPPSRPPRPSQFMRPSRWIDWCSKNSVLHNPLIAPHAAHPATPPHRDSSAYFAGERRSLNSPYSISPLPSASTASMSSSISICRPKSCLMMRTSVVRSTQPDLSGFPPHATKASIMSDSSESSSRFSFCFVITRTNSPNSARARGWKGDDGMLGG
jgi:transmembrane 9 superfamily protein 2/4